MLVAANDPVKVTIRHPINIPNSLNPSIFLSSRSYPSSSSSESSSSVSGFLSPIRYELYLLYIVFLECPLDPLLRVHVVADLAHDRALRLDPLLQALHVDQLHTARTLARGCHPLLLGLRNLLKTDAALEAAAEGSHRGLVK
jgi:hypothetical protein